MAYLINTIKAVLRRSIINWKWAVGIINNINITNFDYITNKPPLSVPGTFKFNRVKYDMHIARYPLQFAR